MTDHHSSPEFELMTLAEWKETLESRGYPEAEMEIRRAIANGRMFKPDPPGCVEVRLSDRPKYLDWNRIQGWRSSQQDMELDFPKSLIKAPFHYPLAYRTQANRMEWTAIRVFRSSVDKFWPATLASSPSAGAKRGPKPKYDWPSFHTEVRRFLAEYGTVDPIVDPGPNGLSWAKVEQHMESWARAKWGIAPGESTIRDQTRKAGNSSS